MCRTVDRGDDEAHSGTGLPGALVEADGLPTNARRADVLDMRAHPNPIANQRGRMILRFNTHAWQPEFVLREDFFVWKSELREELHFGVLGEARIGRKIHNARDVDVRPLHLQPCLENTRARRKSIAKFSHFVAFTA